MELTDIQVFLEENKDNSEVTELLSKYSPKSEDNKETTISDFDTYFKDNEAASKWLQSYTDSKVTKGIDTFKTNKLPTILEEELKKVSNQDLTPEQIQLQELQQQIEELKSAKETESLKLVATDIVSSMNTKLVPFVMGKDKEEIESKANELKSIMNELVELEVSKRLKGTTPKANPNGDNTQMTKEKLMSMSYTDRVKFANDNAELYAKLMK